MFGWRDEGMDAKSVHNVGFSSDRWDSFDYLKKLVDVLAIKSWKSCWSYNFSAVCECTCWKGKRWPCPSHKFQKCLIQPVGACGMWLSWRVRFTWRANCKHISGLRMTQGRGEYGQWDSESMILLEESPGEKTCISRCSVVAFIRICSILHLISETSTRRGRLQS